MNQTTLFSIETALFSAGNNILISLGNFLPVFLAALVVFLIGVLVAKLARTATIKVLEILHISKIVSSPAISKFLTHAQVSQKVEEVAGEVVRYLILLVFFMASLNLLGLSTVTAVLAGFLNYLPKVFAALLILLSGAILAGFIEKLVKGSLASVDVQLGRLLAKLASYTIMIFAVLASISQLGIAQNFIDIIFVGFVATLALAIGLGIGLGSKDIIKSILEDWYKQLKKSA